MRSFIRSNELFAQIQLHHWPEHNDIPLTTVIRDPKADFKQGQRFPSADIRDVAIGRKDKKLIVKITTWENVTTQSRFYLSFSAGGANNSSRILTEYRWQGNQAHGIIMNKIL